MDRRGFIATALAAVGAAITGCSSSSMTAEAQGKKTFEVTKSDEEWRRILPRDVYRVLRKHDTERPGSSPLNNEHRQGIFHCAGCDLPLFSSETKYDSRTGWPSFTAPLPNAVGTQIDRSYFAIRTEVHCRRCGGHLGHVFDDGPRPTYKRYCMNGLALVFRPAETS